jgi:cbb3-type cytochrome oxidase maturation protein
MESLFFLIPLAVLFTALAAAAFFWAIDNDQFEDLDTAGNGILFDSDTAFDIDIAPTPKPTRAPMHD